MLSQATGKRRSAGPMTTPARRRSRATGLTDRRSERDALDRLVEAVWAGESRALVVRGDPGVGKTAPEVRYITFGWRPRIRRCPEITQQTAEQRGPRTRGPSRSATGGRVPRSAKPEGAHWCRRAGNAGLPSRNGAIRAKVLGLRRARPGMPGLDSACVPADGDPHPLPTEPGLLPRLSAAMVHG